MYEVVWAPRKGQKFATLQDAVIHARGKAKDSPGHMPVAIYDDGGVVVGVVTDDANGLTVHRLRWWPVDAPCAYE